MWSAYRITEKQKAGKARNIKEKQLKNSRSTVSKQLVEHHSSARDNRTNSFTIFDRQNASESKSFGGVFFIYDIGNCFAILYHKKTLCVRMRICMIGDGCKPCVLFFLEKMLTNQQERRIIRLVDLSTR